MSDGATSPRPPATDGSEAIDPGPGLDPSRIGAAVRAHRRAGDLSARELARAAGVSPSLISQIERNRTSPSVASLYAIATALGVSLDELLRGTRTDPLPTRPPVPFGVAGGPVAVEGTAGAVRRACERPTLSVASGTRWERLTADDDRGVELMEIAYAGDSPPGDDAPMRSRGREYLVVVAGRLAVEVAGAHHDLGPGDSFVFDAEQPHRLWATDPAGARVITAIVTRTG